MADIPLPEGYNEAEKLPRTKVMLQNCWNDGESIQSRPGIDQLNTAPDLARGAFTFNDKQYHVYGEMLYPVDEDGNLGTAIGGIEGIGRIGVSKGFNDAVIIDIAAAGKGYTLTTGEVLQEITSPNFKSSRSVAHIDGRHVFIPFDGSPAFYSNVGDGGTIDVDAFFDAEQLPDKNTVAINWNNLLYIGGENSFEGFRVVPAETGTPYQRITGRIETGYIGGVAKYGESFLMIGRTIDLDRGFFLLQQGGARRVSNEGIELILKKYSIADLEQIIVNRIEWRGLEIVTYVLGSDSFAFVNEKWVILTTEAGGESFPWRGGFITLFKGAFYCAFDNVVGRLERINTDYGEVFTRKIGIPFHHPDSHHFTLNGMSLTVPQGFEPNEGSIGARFSRDNVIFGKTLFREVGITGNYTNKLEWNYPGGLGYYYGFAGIELVCTDDIYFALEKWVLDI